MCRVKGSSTAEYGIIAVLVAIALVGIALTFGGNLNNVILGWKGDMRGHVRSAAYYEIMEKWGNGSGIGAGGAATYPSPPGTEAYCFANGICLNIPTASGDLATSGANGGELTEQYTNVLSQLAKQLKEKNADPDLVALIKKLSGKGHGLGDKEQALINLCPPGQTCATGNEDKVLDMSLGIQDNREAFNKAYRDLKVYLKAHPGALNADLKAIIGSARANIDRIADTFGDADRDGTSSISVSGGDDDPVFASYEGDAGALTHVNASTIHATVLP